MARIFPFQPYRYSDIAGPLADLLTQPYDKISPAMRARYLEASPFNLVRIILGPALEKDDESDNVYTRAHMHLEDWVGSGVLARESEPGLFPYYQEFTVPDTGERLVRKGFIALGAVEEYSAGVVHRHEQTLSGPKKDRLELLRHTRAHFGQIFMLYPDPSQSVDALLEEAAREAPIASVADEYGARHLLWKISDPDRVSEIQGLMEDKKLIIADGHHRYETALAFHKENPKMPGADRVMMTFVNMHSPGLTILATHRLLSGLPGFQPESFLGRAARTFGVEPLNSVEELRKAWAEAGDGSRIGVAMGESLFLLHREHTGGRLDVTLLHEDLIDGVLGISQEAVREEKHVRYIRGLEPAIEEVRSGEADIGFLLKPTSIEDVARISFGGGVMPQKSTDFYPKLLSGLTIYKY
ncbi:MAG: DUF1015 domain-containing protein [Bryobacteraceae bacterium]